jgi:dTDP-4-dehydrorhamnose 3,5-epimerase
MRVRETEVDGVLLIEPRVFGDERGFFLESWNERAWEAAGVVARFVQDNHSYSQRGVLRGMHYQIEQSQGKLVWVVEGEVFDVAVDLRESSPTFGRWTGAVLSGANKHRLWVPPGCAHGFYVMSEAAHFLYKCTDFYAPHHERAIRWDDPTLAIPWPIPEGCEPVVSASDARAAGFAEAPKYSSPGPGSCGK